MKYFCGLALYHSFALLVLSACSATPTQVGHEDANKLSKTESENFALYAMMASNAYLDPERAYFSIEKLGWVRVDLDGKPTDKNSYSPTWLGRIFSNLQFDIWENRKLNKTVISFKGTDEKVDWVASNLWIGPSVPYKSAKKHVEKYIEKHKNREIVLTGHSLGGGLALSSSLWLGIDAYAFNPSPRVFDGWKNQKNRPSARLFIKIKRFCPRSDRFGQNSEKS